MDAPETRSQLTEACSQLQLKSTMQGRELSRLALAKQNARLALAYHKLERLKNGVQLTQVREAVADVDYQEWKRAYMICDFLSLNSAGCNGAQCTRSVSGYGPAR
jgi:hypothetical protein